MSGVRDNAWDRWLLGALFVAALMRVVPMALWPQMDCVRDECIYRAMAMKILDGQGLMVSSKGWLTAPGFPYLLVLMKATTGAFFAVKWVNIVISLFSAGAVYEIARRVFDLRAARLAVWMFALHPTLAFFTQTMWIETVYIFFLLNAVLAALWAREQPWPRAVAVGVMLAFCILFRGVATYLPPVFFIALIWPSAGWTNRTDFVAAVRRRWRHGAAMLMAVVLFVAPYSLYASPKHGGFLVSDATVGHVMFLGNNEFPPLTFDYGIGMLTGPLYAKYLRSGRLPCPRNQPPVISSKCDVGKAVDWIVENPERFANRVPLRLAQLLNPNSFLTRHIRWGYWPGLPWVLKELTAAYVVFTTMFLVLVGTVGAWARARGPYGIISVGTVIYTCTTIAIMYGMTRFRLPLEPLWIVFAAGAMADPKGAVNALSQSTPRSVGVLLTIPALVALMLWYLPTGFPRFW
jgi:hypothetical protein